jgi:Ca-activated chloride channel family protein
MMDIHHTIRVGLVLSSMLVGGRLLAHEGERHIATEINKANELLRTGDVDGAVKAYGQVQTEAPDRAEVTYNMAVAKYRKGDVAAAEQLFKQTSTDGSDALAARSRYNLGNCNYASALQKAESDRSAAIKGLEGAIDSYRSALEIDPNDADSRANIELAATMIEKLREQEKKEQQKQQDNKQQQQNKDQQQKESKQDDKQKDKSKSQDDKQKQKSQQGQGKDQQKDEQHSQQKDHQQKGENSQEHEKKSGDDAKNQSADKEKQSQKQKPQESASKKEDSKSQSQEPKKATSDEQQQQSQKNNESQAPPDKTADETKAKNQPNKSQQQSQTPTQKKSTNKNDREKDIAQPSEQPKDEKGTAAPKGALTAGDQKAGKTDPKDKDLAGKPEMVQDGAMTTQEAEKMLQAIRDQEMLRRLKRQAAERNQHVPVDRDW